MTTLTTFWPPQINCIVYTFSNRWGFTVNDLVHLGAFQVLVLAIGQVPHSLRNCMSASTVVGTILNQPLYSSLATFCKCNSKPQASWPVSLKVPQKAAPRPKVQWDQKKHKSLKRPKSRVPRMIFSTFLLCFWLALHATKFVKTVISVFVLYLPEFWNVTSADVKLTNYPID